MEEMIAAEKALLSHPEFKAAVAKLDLPANAKVVADGWIYGADKFEKNTRYVPFMVYLSFNDDPDTCHYAAPLPIVPVMSADDFSLVRMDYCPIYGTGDKTLLDYEGRFPWEAYTPNEYDAGIRKAAGLSYRQDMKPYRVVQPEGASVSQNLAMDRDPVTDGSLRWKAELSNGRNGPYTSASTSEKGSCSTTSDMMVERPFTDSRSPI